MVTAPIEDDVEESIADDFVEESMEDEVQVSQTFSVHDAASEENKDKVFDLAPGQQTRQPGNSTVNMASVVPNPNMVESPPSSLGKSVESNGNMTVDRAAAAKNVSSPMFVKATPSSGASPAKTSAATQGG